MTEGAAERAVGIDPDAARLLAAAFGEAGASLEALAGRVDALLRRTGVDSTAPATARGVAQWCGGQAADLQRRAAAADVAAQHPSASPGGDASPSPLESAWSCLLALLDDAAGDGDADLGSRFPEWAHRRRQARAGLAAVGAARKELAVAAYTGGASSAQVEAQRAALRRAGDEHRRRARAGAGEVEALLADLGDHDVRALAAQALQRWGGAKGAEAAQLKAALAPLRARVGDQLAAGARQAYQGGAAPHVEELAHLARGLAFAPERPRGGLLADFGAGLVAGDLDRRRLGDADREAARAAGHVVSGLLAAGDVRDTLAAVARRDWSDVGLGAFGLIPVVGDVAKGADAAREARRAAEAAAAARKKAELAAAMKGTPLEHWRELDPMPNAARAIVDDRKFTEYSMHPKGNHEGKHEAFALLGYDVSTDAGRRAGGDDVVRQIREQLAKAPARKPERSGYGLRVTVDISIRGPNGRLATLETHWQYDHGVEAPKLITNWLKVHR